MFALDSVLFAVYHLFVKEQAEAAVKYDSCSSNRSENAALRNFLVYITYCCTGEHSTRCRQTFPSVEKRESEALLWHSRLNREGRQSPNAHPHLLQLPVPQKYTGGADAAAGERLGAGVQNKDTRGGKGRSYATSPTRKKSIHTGTRRHEDKEALPVTKASNHGPSPPGCVCRGQAGAFSTLLG